MKRLLFLFLFTANAWGFPVPLDQTPVRGFWIPSDSTSQGFDLQRQQGTLNYAMLWYTYDEQGIGTWYLGNGVLDGNRLVMNLLSFEWDGVSETANEAGTAEWSFDDHQIAKFHWQLGERSGTESVTAFQFATGVPLQASSGMWGPPDEGGWGLSVATQGDTRATIVYYYGLDGKARWALGSAPSPDQPIELHSFTGPCLGCSGPEPGFSLAGSLELAVDQDMMLLNLDIDGPHGPWQKATPLEYLTEPLFNKAMPALASDTESLAFSGVNILPMHDDTVLEDHVVVTRDGLIESVEPRLGAEVPQGSRLVSSPGSFLLPGLADSHVHLPLAFNAENDLFVFMAYGVTTIRMMWGNSVLLNRRPLLDSGEMFGPRLFTASPGIESPAFWGGTIEARTAAEATAATFDLWVSGYDFIKIYNNQTVEVYQAIMNEASRLAIDPIGHVPFDVDLGLALDGPQRSIEHLRGYPPKVTSNRVDSWNTSLDMGQVQQWAERSVTAEVWNSPTQVALEHKASDISQLSATPAYRALSFAYKNLLGQSNTQPFAQSSQSILNERIMIKALAEAGAPLLVGTDAGIRFTLPGYSMHEELQIFVDAGVSPYTTLRSATYEFARFMRAEDSWGSIQPGLAADMILVHGNPLEDISRLLDERQGVMVRGEWMSREFIDQRLAELAGD